MQRERGREGGKHNRGLRNQRWGSRGQRTEATTDTTSGGVGTLPTPVQETPASGPRAGVRPRVTDGGGGKVGNRDDDKNNDEDCSGRRQDPLTPGPETSAVMPECQRKTREMGGGHEEAWPGESTHEEDAGPRMGVYEGSDGEAQSGNKERVGNQPDQKMVRKNNGAGAGKPGPNRRRAGKPRFVRINAHQPVAIMKGSRPNRNTIGRDQPRQRLCWCNWRRRHKGRNIWWESVSARRRLTEHNYRSVKDQEREGPPHLF